MTFNDRDRTQTCNLWTRSPTPYPLGQTTMLCLLMKLLVVEFIMMVAGGIVTRVDVDFDVLDL